MTHNYHKNERPQMKNSADPEEIEDLFGKTIDIADSLHHDFVNAAQCIGYARDVLIHSKAYWVRLAEMAKENPNLMPLTVSGTDFIGSYHDELYGLQQQSSIPFSKLSTAAATAGTFSATTSSVSSVVPVKDIGEFPFEPCPFHTEGNQTYADRFAKLDPAMGKTYREIWEAFYATRADRERGALFLMRQAFDHLFGCLAPDDAVRNSEFWHPKKGEKPNQIYRCERVKYAATHIRDRTRANTLVSSTNQILELYKALNVAHDRGALDQDRARKALLAMRRILEDWADALEL